jgi:hypothetical protein
MKRPLVYLFLAAGFSSVSGMAASVGITMTACYSSSPDPFNPSPSWATYVSNAITGIENGCAATGDPNSPANYQSSGMAQGGVSGTTSATIGNFGPGQTIDTAGAIFNSGTNSWNGAASPAGAFAGEFGNQLLDGLLINDNGGAMFSLSELNWSMSSSDAADVFGFTDSFSDPATAAQNVYSPAAVGIIFCNQVMNPGCMNTILNSGQAATTPVDELVFAGIGASLCAASDACLGTTIAQQANYILSNEPFIVANTYSLVDPDTSNVIASVTNLALIAPEPHDGLLAASGLLFVAVMARYRRRVSA